MEKAAEGSAQEGTDAKGHEAVEILY